jgi:hypothetical protein
MRAASLVMLVALVSACSHPSDAPSTAKPETPTSTGSAATSADPPVASPGTGDSATSSANTPQANASHCGGVSRRDIEAIFDGPVLLTRMSHKLAMRSLAVKGDGLTTAVVCSADDGAAEVNYPDTYSCVMIEATYKSVDAARARFAYNRRLAANIEQFPVSFGDESVVASATHILQNGTAIVRQDARMLTLVCAGNGQSTHRVGIVAHKAFLAVVGKAAAKL